MLDAIERMRSRPGLAAWPGLLFALPSWLMNLVVVKRVEPVFSWMRPGPHASAQEYVVMAVVLLLLPVGVVWARMPSLVTDTDGKREFHATNAAVAMGLVLFFVAVAGALGSEIYACEVLRIPNCD